MRSLFWRILGWFLLTALVTIAGFIITSTLALETQPHGGPPAYARLIPYLLKEARDAYEHGGVEQLRPVIERMRNWFETEVVFCDSAGRDLLTGEDRRELLREGRWRPGPPVLRFLPRRRLALGAPSPDGQYSLFLVLPRERVHNWFLLPQHLWVVGTVVLLCYLLALYVARPVRRLEQTVESFGRGDLSARAAPGRQDEIGRLAATFNRMAERIQTLLQAERRLLEDISHELRSPLARLGVAVELARSASDPSAALDRIEKESGRLNDLVGELLAMTRAEGDPAARRSEPVRLDDVVREVADAGALEAEARGCRVSVGELPAVELSGDPELLRRAVENVVRNAIRYTAPGTPVEITLTRTGARAAVVVRDHGPGVPDDALGRIFDPFYRVGADRDRAGGGVGLGLSIARRALALHQGVIEARNSHPGLEVRMDLPIQQSP